MYNTCGLRFITPITEYTSVCSTKNTKRDINYRIYYKRSVKHVK